ncbi:MAG: serine/threonine protein kinase [Deltaproteobacteria bacterium]|nr:serine/threonine protein kinase [Deltaproteobacteria bacterium]
MSRYELLDRIGVGGMAEVYRGRAVADGGFEKPVAIKKVLPNLSRDDRFVRMLVTEAKILASLRQRNIVQIYDVGLGDDGQYFLVMEHVDGCDLGALCDRVDALKMRFPRDLALHVGAEVCDALDHAHKAVDARGKPLGLVHRDVSPSNVLLSRAGEVKLTDFGIAKRREDGSLVSSIKGKFAFMSPEQAEGRPLGPTSDVYSLGIVLYELLLGRRLFSHANDVETLRLAREARVPRPRGLEPEFSEELEQILMKALARDPEQRFASAARFGMELRDFRYSCSTSAGDPAQEIAALVKRLVPGQPSVPSGRTIVEITTMGGFPRAPVLGDHVEEDGLVHALGDDVETRPMRTTRLDADEEWDVSSLATRPTEKALDYVEPASSDYSSDSSSSVDLGLLAPRKTPWRRVAALASLLACLVLAAVVAFGRVLSADRQARAPRRVSSQGTGDSLPSPTMLEPLPKPPEKAVPAPEAVVVPAASVAPPTPRREIAPRPLNTRKPRPAVMKTSTAKRMQKKKPAPGAKRRPKD